MGLPHFSGTIDFDFVVSKIVLKSYQWATIFQGGNSDICVDDIIFDNY